MEQQRKQDSDSGVGSDNGDKRLSATEPSDEDSLSLNVPMSHITEEEGINKDDSSEHISSLTDCDSVRLIEESPTEALKDQINFRDSALSTRFVNYIKGRTAADFDEPLRIEEDSHWPTEQMSKHEMIHQLKEAVELLQDPSRAEQDDVSGVQLYPVEMVNVEESLNGQDSDDGGGGTPKHHDRYPACGPPSFSSPVFGLKPRSAPPSLPCSPPTSCLAPPFLSQASPLRRDSAGHDGGVQRVFMRSHKSLESVDPQFTMRRKMEQLREELELTDHLRDSIESRLKVDLPEDLGSSLMDGVVLCHLANQIRPRSVGSIHVPSPAVPKLSMAKCRRNVENFLDACRKIGVPQSSLCSPYDIIQSRLQPLSVTVQALVSFDTSSPDRKQEVVVSSKSPAPSSPSLVSVTTQTTPPSWQIWDLIGSSLLHVLCLVLLFLAYSWSELT
ncbi:hypothetical protein OYC64_018524 [Pagothenia borchgrevinki]|uniref:Calponin-homology (CH) domain-containing protein n=1 Tax=Pagothenia borchgrevinki TaxID=8213 RepID=A0ABD2GNZ4_PAGBO